MATSRLLVSVSRRLSQTRLCSGGLPTEVLSASPHPKLERVQVLTMQRPPVNALDLNFLQAFPEKMKEIEEKTDAHGVILTSSSPKTFCAGLDIPFLFDKDEAFLRDFSDALQNCWKSLYGTPLAVVAAVSGHALAGGCLISSAADYRVAHKDATIGLPEVHLGILAPYYLRAMVTQLMGHRGAEWALLTGHALDAGLAQSLGLVDEVKDSPEEVMERAEQMISLLVRLNPKGRAETKVAMREGLVKENEERRGQNRDEFAAVVNDKATQAAIRGYFEQLAQRSKKKE